MKKKKRDYSMIRHDDLPEKHEPNGRKIIIEKVDIDRDCFRKTHEERARLKLLKSKIGNT